MFTVLAEVQNILELNSNAKGTHCCISMAAHFECHIADGDV
jgi:hypothetical protein